MWTLTVALGNTSWALMFRTEEAAYKADTEITNGFGATVAVNVKDDFGQDLHTKGDNIHGWLLEDMSKSKLAHIERGLHHARMQQEGQKAAQADATLRHAGPAILSPGMNGPFARPS